MENNRQVLQEITRGYYEAQNDRPGPSGRPGMLYGLPGGNQVDGLPPATSRAVNLYTLDIPAL